MVSALRLISWLPVLALVLTTVAARQSNAQGGGSSARAGGAAGAQVAAPSINSSGSHAASLVDPVALATGAGGAGSGAAESGNSVVRWPAILPGEHVYLELSGADDVAMFTFTSPSAIENLLVGLEFHAGESPVSSFLTAETYSLEDLTKVNPDRRYEDAADGSIAIVDPASGRGILFVRSPGAGILDLWLPDASSALIDVDARLYPRGASPKSGSSCESCLWWTGEVSAMVIDSIFFLACGVGCPEVPGLLCVLSALSFPAAAGVVCTAAIALEPVWPSLCEGFICPYTGYLVDEYFIDLLKEHFAKWICELFDECEAASIAGLIEPTGGGTYSGLIHIEAYVVPDWQGVEYVDFDYSLNGGTTWSDVVGPDSDGKVQFEGVGGIFFDTLAAGITFSANAKIRVQVKDKDGDFADPVYSGAFTIDNQVVLPGVIQVSASLSPTPVEPLGSVHVSGTAKYDTGAPVDFGTAVVGIAGNQWTAPVTIGGHFNLDIHAPDNDSTSSVAVPVAVTVNDGTYSGSTALSLTVKGTGGSGSGWSVAGCAVAKGVQSSSPYEPIGVTSCFNKDDPKVFVWLHLTDVTTSVRARFKLYDPVGQLFGTVDTDWSGSGPWEWYKFWAWWPLSGTTMSNMEGLWSARVYVDDGGGFKQVCTEEFTIRFDFKEHKTANDVQGGEPVSPSNVFTSLDPKVYTWMKMDKAAEELNIRWEWFEANGSLYAAFDHTTDGPPSFCFDWLHAWGWLDIAGTPVAAKTGPWRVDVRVEDPFGSMKLVYQDYYELVEEPAISPQLSVSANPPAPIEGQAIQLSVSASDNAYLDEVVLHWSGGASGSQAWTNVYADSFQSTVALGALPSGAVLDVYATGTDTSGNQGVSEIVKLIVGDDDVTGPVLQGLAVLESGGNGDGIIQPDEQVLISWDASDPKGIGKTSVFLSSVEYPGVPGAPYSVVLGPLPLGEHDILVYAEDADSEPASSILPGTFSVLPGVCSAQLAPSDPYAFVAVGGSSPKFSFSVEPEAEVTGTGSWTFVPGGGWPQGLTYSITSATPSAAVLELSAQPEVFPWMYHATMTWSGSCSYSPSVVLMVPVEVHVLEGSPQAAFVSLSPLGPPEEVTIGVEPSWLILPGTSAWSFEPGAGWPTELSVVLDGSTESTVGLSVFATLVPPEGQYHGEIQWTGGLDYGSASLSVPITVDVEPVPANVHVVQGGGTAAIQAAIDQSLPNDLVLVEYAELDFGELYSGDPLTIDKPLTISGRSKSGRIKIVDTLLHDASVPDPAAITIASGVDGLVRFENLDIRSEENTGYYGWTIAANAFVSKSSAVELFFSNCVVRGEKSYAPEGLCLSPGLEWKQAGGSGIVGECERLVLRDCTVSGGDGPPCGVDPGVPFAVVEVAGAGGDGVNVEGEVLAARSEFYGGAGGNGYAWDNMFGICVYSVGGAGGSALTADDVHTWSVTGEGGKGGHYVDCSGMKLDSPDGAAPLPGPQAVLLVESAPPGGVAMIQLDVPDGNFWGVWVSPGFATPYQIPGVGVGVLSQPSIFLAAGWDSPVFVESVPDFPILFGVMLPVQAVVEPTSGTLAITNPDYVLIVPE